MSSSNTDLKIDAFREQILHAAKNKTQLSIEGGATKSWYGNANTHPKLATHAYSGILEYQPEELVITACRLTFHLASLSSVNVFIFFSRFSNE